MPLQKEHIERTRAWTILTHISHLDLPQVIQLTDLCILQRNNILFKSIHTSNPERKLLLSWGPNSQSRVCNASWASAACEASVDI
jgi:hypothetical protein